MMAKLTLRSLAAHRLRLVSTVLAVMLGVSFVAGTMIFRDTASRSFESTFDRVAETPIVTVRPLQEFTSEDAPRKLIPAALLDTLRERVPGAEGIIGVTEGYAAIVRPDGEPVGGLDTAHVGRAYIETPGSKVRVTSGRAPTGADEVVVEEQTAAEGAISIGQSISIVTQQSTQTMRVVGIYTLGEERLDNVVTFVAFSPDVAQRLLTGPDVYSTIWARPRAGVAEAELVRQLTAALPVGYEVKTGLEIAEDARERIQEIFSLLGRLLLAFAAISILVGSFIIFNTFMMLMAQRIRELALLRLVGASRAQVTRAVLGEAVGIGLVGSTVGLVAGVGVSYLLRILFERFGTSLPLRAPVITPATVLWSYAVGVVITILAAYFPARRAARTPPIAALRDGASMPARSMTVRIILGGLLTVIGGLGLVGGLMSASQDGAVLVAVGGVALFFALTLLSPIVSRPVIKVLGWPFSRLAGTTGRLSRENARRDPRRSAATASALMIGLALVSMASVLAQSMSVSVDRRLDREFGADYSMEPRGLTGFSPAAVDRVAAVPGVRSVAPVQFGTVKVDGAEVGIIVADAAALVIPANLRIESGTDRPGVNELVIQRSLADDKGWRVGTTLSGQYPDNSTATFRIAGIAADNEVVNRPYIMSPASYRPHATGNLLRKAFIDLDDANLAAGRDGVKAALGAYPNIQLKDRQGAKDEARGDIDQILNVILVLLALSIVIAALGIVNTLGLSVIERTKEIGLLRAVGMDRTQVRAMIRYESVVIALFGALLGLGLGVAIGWALQRAMASEGVEVLDLPVLRLGLYLLSAVVIGVVAAIWPAWRAARMNVLRAIHQE